jgi:hypothetical protein
MDGRRTELPVIIVPKNKLLELYTKTPDVFYKTLLSLPDNDILNICKIEEFKDLCNTDKFWQRLWRAEFGSSIPIGNNLSRTFFRRRAIVKLINTLYSDKSFLNLSWAKGRSKDELIHLIDILPVLPDDKYRQTIYNDILGYLVKNNDVNTFSLLIDERTPPIHSVFERMVNLDRGRMIKIILSKFTPLNLKLTIAGIPLNLIYIALSKEVPCDPTFIGKTDINKYTPEDKGKILARMVTDDCQNLMETFLPLVPKNNYGEAFIEAVIKDNIELVKKLRYPNMDLDIALYYANSLNMVKFLYSLDKYIPMKIGILSHVKASDPKIFEYILNQTREFSSDTIRSILGELLSSFLPGKEIKRRFVLILNKLYSLKIRHINPMLIFALLRIMESENKDYGKFYLESILNAINDPKEINLPRYINIAAKNGFSDSLNILLNFAQENNISLKELKPLINTYPPKFRKKLQDYIGQNRIHP